MSKQAVFDKVVRHLRRQGSSSTVGKSGHVNGSPAYATDDGRKCNIGCLLTKAELVQLAYAGDNTSTWVQLSEDFRAKLTKRLGVVDKEGQFMSHLQEVHDEPSSDAEDLEDFEGWRTDVYYRLRGLARRWKLNSKKLSLLRTWVKS